MCLLIDMWLNSQQTMCLTQIWLECHKSLGVYYCVTFNFELLLAACSPHCLHYMHTRLLLGSFWSTGKALSDDTLWAVQWPPHRGHVPPAPPPKISSIVEGTSSSAFSTCFKHHSLSRCLIGRDKTMLWWGNETQLCCSHMRGTEQKIWYVQRIGKDVTS